MHQLRSDIEASNSQAVEKEEAARKEIEELKLQIQEFLLAREHEKNVSANCKATLKAVCCHNCDCFVKDITLFYFTYNEGD